MNFGSGKTINLSKLNTMADGTAEPCHRNQKKF
jgi:hypothetical protein